MKKSTKSNIKKVTKRGVKAAQAGARVAAADAYALGRGIWKGAQQGISDAKKLSARTKRKA